MRVKVRRNDRCWRRPFLVFTACFLLCSSIASAQQPFGDAKKGGPDENNKMRIRSVLRITKSSRQPLIEVEVYSSRAFPALDAAVVLLVGEQVFQGAGYRDKGHVLIFTLTPEKFAKTKTGDEVIVTFQGADPKKVREEDSGGGKEQRWVWKFGKLDKSKIDE